MNQKHAHSKKAPLIKQFLDAKLVLQLIILGFVLDVF